MNKERVKSVQKKLGSTKKQAESIITAQDRMQQVGDCAAYRLDKKDAKKEVAKEKERDAYDSQAWLEHRTVDADNALLEAIGAGKVGAFELFYKLMDRLKDKTETEIRFGLTADEVTRRNLEAGNRLREGGFTMADVPDVPALLSEDIRENSEPEGDSPV